MTEQIGVRITTTSAGPVVDVTIVNHLDTLSDEESLASRAAKAYLAAMVVLGERSATKVEST